MKKNDLPVITINMVLTAAKYLTSDGNISGANRGVKSMKDLLLHLGKLKALDIQLAKTRAKP